ncbi:hypothetical protein BDQ17DRAFT_803625 [Cyathus striatus]|nr:hypothetical protein BDQ17DRAFT_803625 [Cyathus striatus]
MGAALYTDPGSPGIRDSLMSSSNTTAPGTPSSSVRALNASHGGRPDSNYQNNPFDSAEAFNEKRATGASASGSGSGIGKGKRKWIILGVLTALAVIILVVILPIYFKVIKPKNLSTSSSPSSSSSTSGTSSGSAAQPSSTPKAQITVTGGDGSTVTMDDGSTFVYSNPFGGSWYWDENDPFNNGARAQSWSPALNETFRYGIDKMRGVNLGGWLNTEPFMYVFPHR